MTPFLTKSECNPHHVLCNHYQPNGVSMSADIHLLSLPEGCCKNFKTMNLEHLEHYDDCCYENTKLPPKLWECPSRLRLPFSLYCQYLAPASPPTYALPQILIKCEQSLGLRQTLRPGRPGLPALHMSSLTSAHSAPLFLL